MLPVSLIFGHLGITSSYSLDLHPASRHAPSKCLLLRSKILEKVKFSQMNNPSGTSDLAHRPAKYNTGLCAKFCHRTLCHFGVMAVATKI